jgi:hypothetical protein
LECGADELKEINTADAGQPGAVRPDVGASTPESAVRQHLAARSDHRSLVSQVPDRFGPDEPAEGFWQIRDGLVGFDTQGRLVATFAVERFTNSLSETAYAVGSNASCYEQLTAKAKAAG